MKGLNRRRFGHFAVAASLIVTMAGAASAQAATTVNMVLWPGPEGDAMQKVVDAWNKEQGAKQGISVKMILLSRDNTFSRETTEIGAKSSNIDIYFVASYNVNFYQAGLEPIDALDVDESNYFKSAIDSLKIGGKLFALPLDVSNHFLYYRKDLIARLLSDDAWKSKYRDISKIVLGAARDPKEPSEWDADDYLATAAFFSKSANPNSPTQYGTALQLKTLVFNITHWDDLLWGLGGNWLGADGKANLTSSAAKKAMNIYSTIYKNRWTSPELGASRIFRDQLGPRIRQRRVRAAMVSRLCRAYQPEARAEDCRQDRGGADPGQPAFDPCACARHRTQQVCQEQRRRRDLDEVSRNAAGHGRLRQGWRYPLDAQGAERQSEPQRRLWSD